MFLPPITLIAALFSVLPPALALPPAIIALEKPVSKLGERRALFQQLAPSLG